MTAGDSVDSVRCPRCKAEPDHGCSTPSGHPSNEPHLARVNAYWATKQKQETTDE